MSPKREQQPDPPKVWEILIVLLFSVVLVLVCNKCAHECVPFKVNNQSQKQ